jgi:chromosome segregation ATPase
MANNIVPLVQPATLSDVQVEAKNAFDAREKLQTLVDQLEQQRTADANKFLRGVATELAALKSAPDKAFADAQHTKYLAWKTADDELAKRITSLLAIRGGLEKRLTELKESPTYRAEIIALLKAQIEALTELRKGKDAEESVIDKRIEALTTELNELTSAGKAARSRGKGAGEGARSGK